jgi:phenylalanyl-tRNA synthetase beta chain
MRILLSWLREFVDVPESPRELAHALTMAGLTVEGVVEEQGETIFEMDITTNRPDAMNHLGVAREAAAVLGRRVREPEIRFREDSRAATSAASIEIVDPDLCPRYTGRVAVGVKVGYAPDWMRRRLELCGIRSIHNVADITNYVLLEGGHPTHAFDLHTLHGARIVVRRAAAGERLQTLDGVERTLQPHHLVIADADRAVALAGVMGGAETGISLITREVLIESAWFDPASIRRTARQLGMHTEASHRFERGADIEAAPRANDRIAGLLEELAGATVLAGMIDVYPKKPAPRTLRLRRPEVRRHLGVDLPPEEMDRILRALGFAVEGDQVTPPPWRLDVEREIDVIEEIARIWGYERFPLRLPEWGGRGEPPSRRRPEQRVRETARSLGYDEAVTYTFVSAAEAERFGSWPAAPVRNPLSELHGYLRNSAVPGLLRAVEWNLNRGERDVRLFEVGRLYRPAGQEFREPPVLAMAATGLTRPPGWNDVGKPYDVYELKSDVLKVVEIFAAEPRVAAETPGSYYRAGHSGRVLIDGQEAARWGQIDPALAAERKIRQPVFIAEVWLDRLYELPLREPRCRPLPRVPAVDRDFSLLLPQGTRFEQIVEAAGQREYLVRLEPMEIFRGGQVPAGKYSLLLRAVWQREDASLTDEQVNEYSRALVEALRQKLGAEQRA